MSASSLDAWTMADLSFLIRWRPFPSLTSDTIKRPVGSSVRHRQQALWELSLFGDNRHGRLASHQVPVA